MNDPKKSSKIRRVVNSNRTDFSLHSKSRETTRNSLFTFYFLHTGEKTGSSAQRELAKVSTVASVLDVLN